MIYQKGKMIFSQYFYDLLQGHEEGEIILVTSKGIYFRLGTRIFQLTDAKWGPTPIGIGIDNVGFLISSGIVAGQPITLKDGALHLCEGVLQIQGQAYDPNYRFGDLKPELIQRCAALLQGAHRERGVSSLSAPLLLSCGVSEPFGNPLCQIAYPLLTKLIQALRNNQTEDVQDTVRQLIGMGIGLTPSLDDVILGMMYGLLRIAPEHASARMLTDAVKHSADDCTNEISAAYLQAVADGAPFGRLDDLLMGLSGEIPLDIEPILQIGSSSGSEMLLGLLIAAKIIYL